MDGQNRLKKLQSSRGHCTLGTDTSRWVRPGILELQARRGDGGEEASGRPPPSPAGTVYLGPRGAGASEPDTRKEVRHSLV